MTEQKDIPGTIAIRSSKTRKLVAEFKTEDEPTFTKAAEALIADGARFRESTAARRRPRRRELVQR